MKKRKLRNNWNVGHNYELVIMHNDIYSKFWIIGQTHVINKFFKKRNGHEYKNSDNI